MKEKRTVALASLVCFSALFASAPLNAQEADEPAARRAGQPGPVHKQLEKRVGEYTTQTKFSGPPGPPEREFHGTAKLAMALDGRFLVEENSGTWFGQPLKGLRLLGYNNASLRYEGAWTYTMSTGIMSLSGESKDDGKTIEMTAAYDGPMRAKQTLHVTIHDIDKDHFRVDLVSKNPDGSKGLTMETTYTRKK